MTLEPGGLTVNGTFVSTSDRNLKEHFKPVDSGGVLNKVVSLPITEWQYKEKPATRHLGPMAQDFYSAFGIGADDRHIATVDADGVALAAIQGLNQKVEEQRSEIRFRDREIQALQQSVSELKTLVNRLISERTR